MCADVTGSTAVVPTSVYTDSSGSNCDGLTTGSYGGTATFGFNDSAVNGTNSATGSPVLTSSGAVPLFTDSFTFLGDISPVTPAGLYTTSLNFVATGTF